MTQTQTTHTSGPIREAMLVRPLFLLSPLRKIGDVTDIVRVTRWQGPYSYALTDYWQDQRGVVIHGDALKFLD